jgi:hypothetical protein
MATLSTPTLLTNTQGYTEQQHPLGLDRRDDMLAFKAMVEDPALSPAQAQELFAQIEQPLLAELAGDVNHGGVFGAQGLSTDEKRDLFQAFAQKLNGEQLSRVAQAFPNRSDLDLLAESVAHAPSAVKVDFVRHMAARTTEADAPVTPGVFANVTRFGDADASAVATVLGSFKNDEPAAFISAVGHLSDPQLAAVMRAGAHLEVLSVSGQRQPVQITSADPAIVRDIVDTAARCGQAPTQARVFAAGASVLPEVGRFDATGSVGRSLGRLLDADAPALVRIVREQYTAEGRKAPLTQYMTERLRHDPAEGYAAAQQHLQSLGADAASLNRTTPTPDGRGVVYLNALDAGALMGSVMAASRALDGEAKADQEVLSNLASTTSLSINAFGVKVLSPLARGAIVGAGGVARDQIRSHTTDALHDGRAQRADATQPTTAGERLVDTPAWSTFIAEALRVARSNR